MVIDHIYSLIGPAGVALLVLGVAAVYLSLWSFIYLARVGRQFRRGMRDYENGTDSFIAEMEVSNPLIAVVHEVVFRHSEHSNDMRAEVAYLFLKHLRFLNNTLVWLRFIVAVAPLLGLLGTVLGMVSVFHTMAFESSPDATALAGGISQALLTTVMGLVIAIPVLGVYYFMTLQVKEYRIGAIEHSYRLLKKSGRAAGHSCGGHACPVNV